MKTTYRSWLAALVLTFGLALAARAQTSPVGGGGGVSTVGAAAVAAAAANLDQPMFVRVCGPAVSASYSIDTARTGEGVLVEYSFDMVNWYALLVNGGLQYTNDIGLHDPDLFMPGDGFIYSAFTYQSQSVLSVTTNFGIIRSADWLNWTPWATVNINTNFNGITWAPGMITVNGQTLLYGTCWNSGGNFDGKIKCLAASDATFTNWPAASSAVTLITNESPAITGAPALAGNGVNDSFGYLITNATWLTNNVGQSVLLPAGTYLHIAYNWNSVQYDGYTNLQSAMPTLLHLAITNLTSFPLGAEGGMIIKTNNTYRFYGSVGKTGANTFGRFFYSDNTNGMIGNWSTVNFCQEYPRFTFGQSTVTALTGLNKLKLLNAITAGAALPPNPYYNSVAAYSVRRLPGYSGPAMDVRRSTDNAVIQLGFTATGDLDTNTLMSFAGSGSAFVTTWYDQSGFGNNAVQVTNANQPTIVSSGAMQADARNLPTIKWASPASLQTTRNVLVTGGFSIFGYYGRPWATSTYSCVMESADYALGVGWGFLNGTGGSLFGWGSKAFIGAGGGPSSFPLNFACAFASPDSGFINSSNNGVFYEVEAIVGATNGGIYLRNTNISTQLIQGPTISSYTNICIGGNPYIGDYNDGNISEVVLFPQSILPTQQYKIRESINGYFSGGRALLASNVNATLANTLIGTLPTNVFPTATTGAYVIPASDLAPGSTVTGAAFLAANTVYVKSFCAPARMTVNSVNYKLTVSGGHVGFSIYTIDGNTRVADTGAVAVGAANATISLALTSAATLNAGQFYWFAWSADSTTPTFTSVQLVAAPASIYGIGGTAMIGTAANASVAGQNPTTLGAITVNTNVVNIPLVPFKN